MWIEGRALYRDEPGAAARPVTIALDIRGLTVRRLSGEDVALWPFGSLVRLPSPRGTLALGGGGGRGRVEIADATAAAAFAAALKAVPVAGDPVVPRRLVGCLAAAVLSMFLLAAAAWWAAGTLLDGLARMVPDGAARLVDDALLPGTLAALGATPAARCDAPRGRAALERLAARLADAGDVRTPDLRLVAVRSSVPNAVALPGGTIVLTDALVRRARDTDALAGVLAHEIGHVVNRDGVRAMIRDGGALLVLGLVTGRADGAPERLARAVLGAHRSREAELAADRFAVDALAAAGGRAEALAALLEDLDDAVPEGLPALLATHPGGDERRREILRRSAVAPAGPGPVATAADVDAIRAICTEGGGA